MIDEPGHSTGHPAIPKEDTTMFKTISAVVLAVSVLAAPAMAAGRTPHAPAIKTAQHSVLNANAKMGRHHFKQHRHHRFHKRMGALKTHHFSKASFAHIKRG